MSVSVTQIAPFRDGVIALNAGLRPLLDHLRWRGSARQIAEATGVRPITDLHDFRNVMARLGFTSRARRARLIEIDTRLLPCLILLHGRALVVTAAEADGRLRAFDCTLERDVLVDASSERGLLCTFELSPQLAVSSPAQVKSWPNLLLQRFHGTFALLFGLTFLLNLMALVPVFFVQAVYDVIIPSRNLETLEAFVGGVAIVLCGDACLRIIRGMLLAQLGARLDFIVGSSLLEKLLGLPLQLLEAMTDGTKVAQLREGDIVRNALSGQLALSLFEMPFMFVFVAALAVIGGWLAIVPLVMIMVSVLIGLLVLRYVRASVRRQPVNPADHQALLVEMLTNITAIKASGTETLWRERFRERSAASAMMVARELRTNTITETVAYVINITSGAATLGVGAAIALNGSLSVGALIASMTIVWRLLAPIQGTFIALTRLEQVRQSGERLARFMQAPSETPVNSGQQNTTRARRFAGRITFDKVYFRHDSHQEPALASVSFAIEPGQVVAIAGGNGSGKSTLLKLVTALIQPQMGAVSIDGVDTRQLRPADLRQWVTLLPQRASLFEGTLRDNLLLANPQASDADLWECLTQVGLADEIRERPAGLDSKADEHLSENVVKRLALARTLLIDASVVLLDEPNVLLDRHGDDIVLEQIETLRGRATVLLATHNPAHVQAADRAIVLRQGTIIHDGTPQDLMRRLSGQAK